MTTEKIYVLKHEKEGTLERSYNDIFNETYIEDFCDKPGKYKVFRRVVDGGVTTISKIREFSLDTSVDVTRTYNAPGLEGTISSTPPAPSGEFRMVQDVGNTYKIVDSNGNELYNGFTLNDLEKTKEAMGSPGPVEDKDMTDQKFLKYLMIFGAGALVGGVAVFLIMDSRHKKEIEEITKQVSVLKDEVQMQAVQNQKKDNFLSDFNDERGGFDPYDIR